MTKDEMKNEYSAFILKISEILGLGKPVDILKLCTTTDLFFKPLEEWIIELEKENAELKSKNCWKTCEYAEPKSQWISQHIQNVEQLAKAKELIKKLVHEFYYLCELYNFATDYECLADVKQFLNCEVLDDKWR